MLRNQSFLCLTAVFLLTLASSFVAIRAAPGDLDATFNANGRLSFGFGFGPDYATGVAKQSDGKYVVVANTNTPTATVRAGCLIARYNPDGTLDESFGDRGTVRRHLNIGHCDLNSVLIQNDGKIIVAGDNGSRSLFFGDLILLRLRSDGSPDPKFGASGTVTIDFAGAPDYFSSFAIQPDGRIVVGAYSHMGPNISIVRINPDGTFDSSFGIGGKIQTDFRPNTAEIDALAIQSDGRIIIGGMISKNLVDNFLLVRYNPDGSLDGSFGLGGLVTLDTGPASRIDSIAIDEEGRIVAAGYSGHWDYPDITIIRLQQDGRLDPRFGDNGRVVSSIDQKSSMAKVVRCLPNGKLAVVGLIGNSFGPNGILYLDFVTVRYLPNGDLDVTYGNSGVATADFGATDDSAYAAEIEDDGTILVVGGSRRSNQNDTAIARFLPSGDLDPEFGGVGKLISPIGEGVQSAKGFAVQTDGKIVIAGYASTANGSVFALARTGADGFLDPTFDGDGRVSTVVRSGQYAYAEDVAVQSDGRIIAVGLLTGGGTDEIAAVRYMPDGSLDTSFGNDGIITFNYNSDDTKASALVIQPDGKIVIVGEACGGRHDNFFVVRLRTDGSFDRSFGNGGMLVTSGTSEARAVALTSDGKIVVGGGFNQFTVARYLPNGIQDLKFGTGGLVQTTIGPSSQVHSLAIDENGRVLATGPNGFSMVRYNSDGTLDASFGNNGVVVVSNINQYGQANSIALRGDGKIVVSGFVETDLGGNVAIQYAAARFNSNGSLDGAFGSNGIALAGTFGRARDMKLDSLGRIVIVGEAGGFFSLTRLVGD